MCWPANTVGAFFIAVIIFDMIQKNYSDLPYHAMAGVVMTFLFWLVCSFVSVSVSGALLIVPAVFLTVFLFTVWFMNESLKQRGCCMNCSGDANKKGKLVKRETPLNGSASTSNASNTSTSSTFFKWLQSIFNPSAISGTETCKTTLTGTQA